MTAAEKYVAAVYLVVFATVLAWVLIIASKLQRLEHDLATQIARGAEPEAQLAHSTSVESPSADHRHRVVLEAGPRPGATK